MWDDVNKKIKFMFDENFYKTLSDEEFAFVVSHECMHIINMHIFLLKDKIDDLINKKKENSELMQFKYKMNVAMDCIVNDSLTNLYKLDKLKTIGSLSKKPLPVLYGMDKIKTHTHDMTATEVYYILPEEEGQQGENNHDWSSFFEKDGSVNEDFLNKIKNFIDKNIENSAMSDKEAADVEKMREQLKNSSDSRAARVGNEIGGNLRAINRLGSNTLSWDKILFQFVETKKITDCWNRPHRKLNAIYPKAILPSYVPEEKEEIFIAIDASGSIDAHAFQLFTDVVRNTPKRFKITCITFDTVCYNWDITKQEVPRGGGGTDFAIIEKYILANCKKYPKAVFVLTDGENYDGKVEVKDPTKWCWLLYGRSCKENIKHMKCLEFNKLLK